MLYCVNGQPEWLTEDEIFEHFGTTNGSGKLSNLHLGLGFQLKLHIIVG